MTAKTIPLVIIGDALVESDETATITLSGEVGATLSPTAFQATVTISNDDTTGLPWPNGWNYRYTLGVPIWPGASVSLATFLMPVIELRDDLKVVSSGGTVSFNDGHDIRFENAAGTKLGHVTMHYNGSTGLLIALVNFARDFTAADTVYIYTGNTLAGVQEDLPASRAGGWLAWFSGNVGLDRTGLGRNLFATGTPGSGAIGSWPAHVMDGIDDKFTQAASTYLDGLAALSYVSFHQCSDISIKAEIFNVAVGTTADLSLHLDASADNQLTTTVRFGSTLYQFQSANNSQTTNPQAVGAAFSTGDPIRMAINGAMTVPPTPVTIAASTVTNINDTLEWGAGDRGDLQFFIGRLSFLGFCAAELPNAALQSMTAVFINPRNVYSISAPETTSPVPSVSIGRSGAEFRAEGNSGSFVVTYTITRTTPTTATSSVNWTLTGALNAADCIAGQAFSGTANFAIGATTATFTLTILGDAGVEPDETETATLLDAGRVNCTLGTPSTVNVTITDDDTTVASNLFTNPFGHVSAHHMGIGNNPRFGRPPFCTQANALADPPLASAYSAGVEIPAGSARNSPARRAAMGTSQWLRDIRVGSSNLGRKWAYEVTKNNTNYPLITVKIFNKPDIATDDGPNFTCRLPSAASGHFLPVKGENISDTADFNVMAYPRFLTAESNGDPNHVVLFYSYSNETFTIDSINKTYTNQNAQFAREFRIDQRDYYARPTGNEGDFGTSASRLRHPSMQLEGHELNPNNPKFLGHGFNCTGARKVPAADAGVRDAFPSFTDAQYQARQLQSRRVCFPAYGIDGSASPDSANPSQNNGDQPYGTCYTFYSLAEYNECRALIGDTNLRGLRVAEAIYYYGLYLVDGMSEWSWTPGGTSASIGPTMQIRCDGRLGKNADGSNITPVANNNSFIVNLIAAALDSIYPFMVPIFNPVTHVTMHGMTSASRTTPIYLCQGSTGPRGPTPYGHGWGAGKLPVHLNTAWNAPTPASYIPEVEP